jgi:hypothetical protein
MFRLSGALFLFLIFILKSPNRLVAQDELRFPEGTQLEYFCKGFITKKKSGTTVTITEYTGDYEKCLEATKGFEKRLNSGLFGPKVAKAHYFFLCEVSKAASKNSTKSESFGAFVGNWSEHFPIVSPESKSSRDYTIKDIESAIFRLTLQKTKRSKVPADPVDD